jgi:alpha-tubulin suppressor-like RCC1 family protein
MKTPNAELLEFFKKSSTSIIDIKMSKFHTVFLSKSGEVFTCGFGMDGRLGTKYVIFAFELVKIKLKQRKKILSKVTTMK